MADASAPALAPPTTSADQDGTSERPDAVSAMVTARSLDHRVEDLSQRSETTQVFANPDGTWTSEAATGPVRARDEKGAWSDIDTTLVAVQGGFAPRGALGDLVVSDGGDKVFAAIEVGDKGFGWSWPTVLPVPLVEGSTATYADVVDGGDLVVTATPAGFRHDIVLRQAPVDPMSFQIPVSTNGAVLSEDRTGELAISTKAGEDLVTAPAPVMYDSSQDTVGNPENLAGVNTVVSKTGTGGVVTLTPDQGFLTDPETVYPVTIDPVFTTYPMADTWVGSTNLTAVHPADQELVVGTNNSGAAKYRTFLQFANGVWDHKAVSSATLTMRNFDAATCTGSAVQVARVTEYWTNGITNWSNQPSVQGTGAANSSVAKGYSASCPSADVAWNLTAIVQGWATGATTNYGVRVAGVSETVNSSFRKYRSNDYTVAGLQPRLSVTYNSYPNTPTAVSATTLSNGLVRTVTPTLSATVSDPDGASVAGRFYVYAGATLVWSGTSASVASGGKASIVVPAGKLTNGTTYSVKVNAFDGSLASAAQGSLGFVVDTVAPTVALTASGYAAGQWRETAPASNVFTLSGASDVTTFKIEKDGVASPLAADSAGDATLAWNPASGAHTLKVTPTDKAGNTGATVSFSFGTGPAEFSSPTVAQRSTSAFPVNIGGPPNATGASFAWRVAGATTWTPATSLTRVSGGAWDGSVTASGSGSTSGDLVWKATAETDPATSANLAAPALVEVRACFTYSPGGSVCTDPRQVQLAPSAFGGNFPVTGVGPAQVALFTGEMNLTAVDAAEETAGFGRTFTSFDASTVTGGVFGPGWSDAPILAASPDASGTVIDNRGKDGTFVLVDASGGSQVFVPASGSATSFVPLEPTGDATQLIHSSGPPETVELTRPLGSGLVKTSWQLTSSDSGGDSEWVLDSVDTPGTANDAVVVSEAERPVWIRQSDPDAASACTKARQSVGCRALTITYTGSGAATRVASVALVMGAADQNNVTSEMITTYTYDPSGKLSTACGQKPSADQPTLCTAYDYTTVDGRTVISKLTPPGLKPWRFDYTSSGRLQAVKRERPTGGDSIWSVDYTVAMDSSSLPNMTTNATREWGQESAPTHLFAVYESTTLNPALTNASLYYTGEDGTLTNTASYGPSGWLVDTTWYNARGDVIQQLNGHGWSRVQTAPAADRPATALLASSFMVYATYGDVADVGSTAIVDDYGPAHTSVLKDGTKGLWRSHTHFVYDDAPGVPAELLAGRPPLTPNPDGTTPDGIGLLVEQISSVSDANMTTDYDPATTKNYYKPMATGDGDGWLSGTPVRVATQSGANAAANEWSTSVTRFDATGRVIESRLPGGGADSTGAGNDAHSMTTTYYTATGTGDCGEKPLWTGLACKTGPAGQPSAPLMPITWIKSYDSELRPTLIEESVDGTVTRSTSATFDAIGRPTTSTTQTSGPEVTNETITSTDTYDSATGLPTAVTSGGKTTTTGYDNWGRPTLYVDSMGTSSSTAYDAAGNIASQEDGAATYTYSYDSHGLLTDVDAGGGVGHFGYEYARDGTLASLTYPNGVKATNTYDELGARTGLAYAQGSTDLVGFTTTLDAYSRTVGASSVASSQEYIADLTGRLIKTRDTRTADSSGETGCTTRTYGFDDASNRRTFASYGPDATEGTCQTSNPAISKTSTYDTAGRIRNAGYDYDTLGRTLKTPATDVGAGGEVVATYHADDMVASMTQDVANNVTGASEPTAMTYQLDPDERINSIVTKVNGSEAERIRYLFPGSGDSPSVIESSTDGGSDWQRTRYVTVPGAGMAAWAASGNSMLQLANPHGDIVATMPNVEHAQSLTSYNETDEFGNPTTTESSSSRYGYLGTDQRAADTTSLATTLMGARIYNPATGAFLSGDSVRGGNQTPYTYPQNPVDQSDVSGLCYQGRSSAPPIIDRSGFVGVPKRYCYDTEGSHKGWHDYCTKSSDSYHVVSLKGPCAYHDMCLQHGWGNFRGSCDSMFLLYMQRNCKYYFDRHAEVGRDLTGSYSRAGCYARVRSMFSAVSTVTSKEGGNYNRGKGLPCWIVVRGSDITCEDLY